MEWVGTVLGSLTHVRVWQRYRMENERLGEEKEHALGRVVRERSK